MTRAARPPACTAAPAPAPTAAAHHLGFDAFAAAPLAHDAPMPAETAQPACDTRRKFVRLLERRADGLVLFEFAIGWPELSVELLLPTAAFDEFCATHQVQWLPLSRPDPSHAGVDDDRDHDPPEETRG